MLKKLLLALGISMILFGTVGLPLAQAVKNPPVGTEGPIIDEPEPGNAGSEGSNIGQMFTNKEYRVIAYGGWLTPSYVIQDKCEDKEIMTDEEKKAAQAERERLKKDYKVQKDKGWFTKMLTGLLTEIAELVINIIFEPKCDRGLFSLSLTSDLAKIGQSVNVANNYIIMKMAGIMQLLAYALALVFIVFYSLMYMIGYQQISPYKFSMRLFFACVLVWFAPYIAQDILNLNNVLVFTLSEMKFTFDGATVASSGDVAHAIYAYMDGMVKQLTDNIILGLIGIFMIFYLIGPIVGLLLWWYGRLLKIMFYVVISPIMMIMMALPQTAKMSSQWFRNFIGEVFSQSFVVIGMMLISLILVNLQDMDTLIGLGFIGKALLVYAAINFMAGLPAMASGFIGGISGATPTAGNLFGMMKKMKNTVASAPKSAVKVAKKGKAMVGGAINTGKTIKKGATNMKTSYQANRKQALENAAYKGEGAKTKGALGEGMKNGKLSGLVGGIAGKLSTMGDSTVAGTKARLDKPNGNSKEIEQGTKNHLKNKLAREEVKKDAKDLTKENEKLKRQEAVANYKNQYANKLVPTKDAKIENGKPKKEPKKPPSPEKQEKERLKNLSPLERLTEEKAKQFNLRTNIEDHNASTHNAYNSELKGQNDASGNERSVSDIVGQANTNKNKKQKLDHFLNGNNRDNQNNNKNKNDQSGKKGRKK